MTASAAPQRRLVFATRNEGKRRELAALVPGGLEVLSLADFPGVPEVIEDGETFEDNARKKAVEIARATSLPALADDSGLCVDALGGAPGVHSARYAPGTDRDRNARLVSALEGVPADARGARFVAVLCFALPGGEVVVTRGECRGVITRAPQGEGGFGYDPLFLIPELGRTFAELTRDEKGERSHRGRAFEAMRPHLERLMTQR